MTIALQGLREVAIVDLACSPEFPLRLERPHVRELADSISELGCIHPPLARLEQDGSYTVGPGEDRIAAHVLLGLSTVTVRLISCEDHELELLRAAENQVRRKESPAELLEMVERLTAERDSVGEALTAARLELGDGAARDEEQAARAAEELADRKAIADYEALLWAQGRPGPDPDGLVDEDPEPGRRGRPKTDRMRAVERVAAETGRNPDSVRKAIEREEKRREKASIECWGREQAPEWLEPVLALRKTISGVYDRMKAAAGTLTATKLDMTAEREELRVTARAIRLRRPAAVCAWCKNVDRYVADCTACQGRGWVSEEMLEQVPDVLRDPRKAMVQGQEVELEYDPSASMQAALDGRIAARVEAAAAAQERDEGTVREFLAGVVAGAEHGEVEAPLIQAEDYFFPPPPEEPDPDAEAAWQAEQAERAEALDANDSDFDDGPSLEDML